MNSTKMGSSTLTGCVINRNADFIEYQYLRQAKGVADMPIRLRTIRCSEF